jgi:hypothetical protein
MITTYAPAKLKRDISIDMDATADPRLIGQQRMMSTLSLARDAREKFSQKGNCFVSGYRLWIDSDALEEWYKDNSDGPTPPEQLFVYEFDQDNERTHKTLLMEAGTAKGFVDTFRGGLQDLVKGLQEEVQEMNPLKSQQEYVSQLKQYLDDFRDEIEEVGMTFTNDARNHILQKFFMTGALAIIAEPKENLDFNKEQKKRNLF